MAPKASSNNSCCKWCKKPFATTPNPLVSAPASKDVLKRRTPCSNECRPCANFQSLTEPYKSMSKAVLLETLEDEVKHNVYMDGLERSCEQRRQGKRVTSSGGAEAVDASYVENASAFSTKQVIGYFWPVELLRKHSKTVPKKLTSLNHQGRVLKGVTLEEFAVGAIEVSTTSTRGAKRIAELAKDDSDHEGEASSAFEIAQKKLRVVGVSSEENPEIALKMPGKSEDDTDELNAILFGGPRQEKGVDDEQDKKRRATVRNKKAVSLPSKPASQPDGGNAPSAEAAGTASSSTGWNLNSMSAPVSHKKAASESKELDKAEALVLSVNQLKFQVQEESSIMLITLKTVRALTDKVSNRLTPDATQFFMDAVKRSGSSSRAAAVWQSLKDSKACLDAIDEFIEALQDAEASPQTVTTRSSRLKDFGIQLPRNVNFVICKKNAEELLQQGQLDQLFLFLDPSKHAQDAGIMSVLPPTEDEDTRKELVREYQVGCISHLINNLMLKEFQSNPSSKEFDDDKKKFMLGCVQALIDFLQGLKESSIYDTAFPEKTPVREDLERIMFITKRLMSPDPLSAAECESVHSAKSLLLKKGSHFYTCLVTFPVGSWIMDFVGTMLTQSRNDQLLAKEFEGVYDFAEKCSITVDGVMKKDKDGAIDIFIPNPAKFGDMSSKYFAFMESASQSVKDLMQTQHTVVRNLIEQLMAALIDAAALKLDDAFEKLNSKLCSCFGTANKEGEPWTEAKSSECCQDLVSMTRMQPWPKLQLAKALGKNNAISMDKLAASVVSFGQCLQKAFPKLLALKESEPTEAVVMSLEIRDLFSILHDAEVAKAMSKLTPKMGPSTTALLGLINKQVGHFLSKTADTFGNFLTGILETEPQALLLLKASIVGIADFESDDKNMGRVENEIDFGAIFTAFAKYFEEGKHAKLKFAEKEISVDVSFLCVAGSLQQMSKYVLTVKELVDTGALKVDFKQLIQTHMQCALEKKEVPKSDSKLSFFKMVPQYLPSLTKAAQAHQDIVNKLGESVIANFNQIKDYHASLVGVLVQSFKLGLDECAAELKAMGNLFDESFSKIREKHSVPDLFHASVLDREAIGRLCHDADVKTVLFAANKAGSQCALMQAFVEGAKSLPLIQKDLGSEVAALMSDIQAFATNNNQKVMAKDAEKVTLAHVSYFQASVSLSQAMVRTLNPGETRTGLISKCLSLLEKGKMVADPTLAKKATQALAGK